MAGRRPLLASVLRSLVAFGLVLGVGCGRDGPVPAPSRAGTPQPTEADVRDFLRGNLCRCTGYASIVRALLDAPHKAPAQPGERNS